MRTRHGLNSSFVIVISAAVMLRKAARGRKMESFILRVIETMRRGLGDGSSVCVEYRCWK